MNEKVLLNLGLTRVQVEILSYLLASGAQKASIIARIIKRPRGVVYKGLEELNALGLVIRKDEKNQVTFFMIEHPANLEAILDRREQELRRTKHEFKALLPDLVSAYNLVSNKPGVRFYEGEAGIKRVLEDTLVSNPDKKLCTFSDVASYAKYLGDWNITYYAPKRKKLGIFEQVIIPDNVEAMEYMKNYPSKDVTDIVFIDHTMHPFATEINIYNNKVSFITFLPNSMIGVIMENKEIYQTLMSVFGFVWNFTKTHLRATQPEWLSEYKNKVGEIGASKAAESV